MPSKAKLGIRKFNKKMVKSQAGELRTRHSHPTAIQCQRPQPLVLTGRLV